MVKKTYIPDRGDMVWMNFSPTKGHEQAGQRPALVVSHKSYNKLLGLMLVCPITTKIKGYPFEVVIHTDDIKGAVLADQIRNIDWKNRKPHFIAKAPQRAIIDVQDILGKIIV